MSAPVVHPEVRTFVEAVRAALDDLAPEEVEELTGGLEADLDDTLADSAGFSGSLGGEGDHGARLGDPVTYAEELRAAAGLPPRTAGGERPGAVGRVNALVASARTRRDGVVRRLESQRWWPLAREYGRTLRPVWWVIRAWVAFQLVHAWTGHGYGSTLPLSPGAWLVALVLLVTSVEAGRRTLLAPRDPVVPVPSRGRFGVLSRLLVAANVGAVLLLPIAAEHAHEQTLVYGDGYIVPPANGLWLNGTEVRNVFPYDAQGRPLSGVQLVDENGNRLEVGDSARMPLIDAQGNVVAQVPGVGQDSAQLWNVFPLRQQVIPPYVDPAPSADRTLPYPAPLPDPTAGPLLAPAATPTAATPTAATPTAATATAAPTTAPTPTRTP
jgi:hypothetical protein